MKEIVKFISGATAFKFGRGSKIQSFEEMDIPHVIRGLKTTLRTEVMESDIPWLLSKPDMKRM